MKKNYLLLLLLPFLLMACPQKENVEPDKENAYVEKVEGPDAGTVGEAVQLDVYFVVKNGCGQFDSFSSSTSQNVTTVLVHPVYIGQACTLNLPTRKVTYTFTPTNRGIHTLKFWQSANTFVSKTITIE